MHIDGVSQGKRFQSHMASACSGMIFHICIPSEELSILDNVKSRLCQGPELGDLYRRITSKVAHAQLVWPVVLEWRRPETLLMVLS